MHKAGYKISNMRRVKLGMTGGISYAQFIRKGVAMKACRMAKIRFYQILSPGEIRLFPEIPKLNHAFGLDSFNRWHPNFTFQMKNRNST